MTETNPTATTTSDDLDLITIFHRAASFVRRFGRLICLFTLGGALSGFLLFKIVTPTYSSTLLLHSFTLTNTEQIGIISNWNELLRHKEYQALSNRLNVDVTLLRKLRRLEAAETQKMFSPVNPNGFLVTALVKDNSILPKLQSGIIYGLENSDYIKARLTSKRANLKTLIARSKVEIAKLDSMKKRLEQSTSSGTGYLLDVSGINTEMMALTEKMLEYEDQLRFANGVQVLHPFEKFEKPVSPKLFKSVVLGALAGFAVGYLLSLFLYVRGKIRRRRNLGLLP